MDKPLHATELQEQLKATRLQARLLEAQHQVKLLESTYMYPPAVSAWGRIVPPRELVEPQDRALLLDPDQRRKGAHQAFRTEQEHAEIRDVSRALADGNWAIGGMMKALTNYTVRTGFTYRLAPKKGKDVDSKALADAQSWLDWDIKRTKWWLEEREIFVRSRRDGEVFRRHFEREDGTHDVRYIEPEQIVNPKGKDAEDNRGDWSFGVLRDKDDTAKVIAYWVTYTGRAEDGEEVPAEEIEHLKINVDGIVRRGLSDFYCVAEVADELRKLHRNMRRGGAMLSSIPWIEQFTSATKGQVESFVSGRAQLSVPDPLTGQTKHVEQYQPGTVPRIPKGREYLPPPLAQNTANFVEIARLARQALCSRWNAPESITGDASNGAYASLAVAESPFVAAAEVEQKFYCEFCRDEKWRMLRTAGATGKIKPEVLDACDLIVEATTVVVRNRLDVTTENEKKLANGIISPQQWAAQDGDQDFEQTQAEIAAAKKLGWSPAAAAGAPPGPSLGPGLGMIGESREHQQAIDAVLREFGIWS